MTGKGPGPEGGLGPLAPPEGSVGVVGGRGEVGPVAPPVGSVGVVGGVGGTAPVAPPSLVGGVGPWGVPGPWL